MLSAHSSRVGRSNENGPIQAKCWNGQVTVRGFVDNGVIKKLGRRSSMTKKKGNWRSVSLGEAAVVTAIISGSGRPGARTFIDDLVGAVAMASSKTDWILDIKMPNAGPGADLPNGPFPGRAFVPSNEDYLGEIIVWVENGHLSGLEYA
jgi:hypothetical protein